MKYGIGFMMAINKPLFWKKGWNLSLRRTDKGFVFIAALLWITIWISTPPLHWMLFESFDRDNKND